MKNKKFTLVLAFIVLGTGVLLATLGVLAGENQEIMNKGVNVCLECIGIG